MGGYSKWRLSKIYVVTTAFTTKPTNSEDWNFISFTLLVVLLVKKLSSPRYFQFAGGEVQAFKLCVQFPTDLRVELSKPVDLPLNHI